MLKIEKRRMIPNRQSGKLNSNNKKFNKHGTAFVGLKLRFKINFTINTE